jgi:hypothetical protein
MTNQKVKNLTSPLMGVPIKSGKVRVFENVVRGISLVLHDPEGSHYRI